MLPVTFSLNSVVSSALNHALLAHKIALCNLKCDCSQSNETSVKWFKSFNAGDISLWIPAELFRRESETAVNWSEIGKRECCIKNFYHRKYSKEISFKERGRVGVPSCFPPLFFSFFINSCSQTSVNPSMLYICWFCCKISFNNSIDKAFPANFG